MKKAIQRLLHRNFFLCYYGILWDWKWAGSECCRRWTLLARGAQGPGSHQAELLNHLPGKFLVLRASIPPGAALLCQVFTRERMADAVKQSVSSWWECEGFGSIWFMSCVWTRQSRSCGCAGWACALIVTWFAGMRMSCSSAWGGAGGVIERCFPWST